MISQANNILDWAKTGVTFGSQVVNKYEQTIVGRDRSDRQYKRLVGMDSKINKDNSNNDW